MNDTCANVTGFWKEAWLDSCTYSVIAFYVWTFGVGFILSIVVGLVLGTVALRKLEGDEVQISRGLYFNILITAIVYAAGAVDWHPVALTLRVAELIVHQAETSMLINAASEEYIFGFAFVIFIMPAILGLVTFGGSIFAIHQPNATGATLLFYMLTILVTILMEGTKMWTMTKAERRKTRRPTKIGIRDVWGSCSSLFMASVYPFEFACALAMTITYYMKIPYATYVALLASGFLALAARSELMCVEWKFLIAQESSSRRDSHTTVGGGSGSPARSPASPNTTRTSPMGLNPHNPRGSPTRSPTTSPAAQLMPSQLSGSVEFTVIPSPLPRNMRAIGPTGATRVLDQVLDHE